MRVSYKVLAEERSQDILKLAKACRKYKKEISRLKKLVGEEE